MISEQWKNMDFNSQTVCVCVCRCVCIRQSISGVLTNENDLFLLWVVIAYSSWKRTNKRCEKRGAFREGSGSQLRVSYSFSSQCLVTDCLCYTCNDLRETITEAQHSLHPAHPSPLTQLNQCYIINGWSATVLSPLVWRSWHTEMRFLTGRDWGWCPAPCWARAGLLHLHWEVEVG